MTPLRPYTRRPTPDERRRSSAALRREFFENMVLALLAWAVMTLLATVGHHIVSMGVGQ